MMLDAALHEPFGPIGIVVIGEVADFDVGLTDEGLKEADPRVARHGVGVERIGALHRLGSWRRAPLLAQAIRLDEGPASPFHAGALS